MTYKIIGDRLHLYCICDSTILFLQKMKQLLVDNGFTDIESEGRMLEPDDVRIPKDKPWCNYEFECSGVIPKDKMQTKVIDEPLEAQNERNN